MAAWLLASRRLQWLTLLDVGGLTGWFVMALVFSALVAALPGGAHWRYSLARSPDDGRADRLGRPRIRRAYFLSGFPWYYLAHSQFRHLYLIQIADFASSLGISLLIAIVNAMLVDLATLPLFGRSRQGIRLNRRQYVRLCL